MYDMVAVYGVYKWNEFEKSYTNPGISTRYLTHMKLDKGMAVTFITSYWFLEVSSSSVYGILESEHSFHQLLINKTSSYENSCMRQVDVFAVQLIAGMESSKYYRMEPAFARHLDRLGVQHEVAVDSRVLGLHKESRSSIAIGTSTSTKTASKAYGFGDTWLEMLKDLEQTVDLSVLTLDYTSVYTKYRSCPTITNELREVLSLKDQQQRSAVVNKYICRVLKSLATTLVGAWLLNTKVWDKAMEFFDSTDTGKQMIELFHRTCKETSCDPDDLKTYYISCLKFREYTDEVLGNQNEAFLASDSAVPPFLIVNKYALTSLDQMLQSICAKRQKALGSGANVRGPSGEPPHYRHYRDFITTGGHLGLEPLSSRRAAGVGLTVTKEGAFIPATEANVGKKTGALLLTTALMYHRQITKNEDYKIPDSGDGTLETLSYIATEEAKRSATNPAIFGSGPQAMNQFYRQQFPTWTSFSISSSGVKFVM